MTKAVCQHLGWDSHSEELTPKSLFLSKGTTDLKLHSGSKPLLKNKRNPFSLLWVKSMINFFIGQFSNFKFHISLMESNNKKIIFFQWPLEPFTKKCNHILVKKKYSLNSKKEKYFRSYSKTTI